MLAESRRGTRVGGGFAHKTRGGGGGGGTLPSPAAAAELLDLVPLALGGLERARMLVRAVVATARLSLALPAEELEVNATRPTPTARLGGGGLYEEKQRERGEEQLHGGREGHREGLPCENFHAASCIDARAQLHMLRYYCLE